MKRLFYSILILLMIPSLLMAQGLSLKSINDNLTTNYSTTAVTQAWVNSRGFLTTADFSAYRLVVDSYSTSEVDTLLSAKLDVTTAASTYATITALNLKANSADVYTKLETDATLEAYILAQIFATEAYVNATDEAIIIDNDSQDVQIEANRAAIAALPAGVTKVYVDGTDEATIIRVASAEVAINGIIVGSGFATTDYVNGTDETLMTVANWLLANKANSTDVYTKTQADETLEAYAYTKAETNATIEAAIAAIPTPSVNLTISVVAGETLAAGDVVSLVNTADVITAKKTDNTNVSGICQGAYDTTETAIILLKGTDTNQSGLITGGLYFRQADYSIGTTPISINGSYIFVGYGKSSSELILD